jgi:hypothetical protein
MSFHSLYSSFVPLCLCVQHSNNALVLWTLGWKVKVEAKEFQKLRLTNLTNLTNLTSEKKRDNRLAFFEESPQFEVKESNCLALFRLETKIKECSICFLCLFIRIFAAGYNKIERYESKKNPIFFDICAGGFRWH